MSGLVFFVVDEIVILFLTGEKLLDSTNETSFIAGRLQPATHYILTVRAHTSKGAGEPAMVEARTHELGKLFIVFGNWLFVRVGNWFVVLFCN